MLAKLPVVGVAGGWLDERGAIRKPAKQTQRLIALHVAEAFTTDPATDSSPRRKQADDVIDSDHPARWRCQQALQQP